MNIIQIGCNSGKDTHSKLIEESESAVLIDVHSQMENQSLFKNDYQFLVLDALAENQNIYNEYKQKLIEFQNTQREFNDLN